MKVKIQIILGSTRKNRFSEKPGAYLLDELKKREGVSAELIDLRDWPLPFYDEAASPTSLKGNFQNELAKKWNAKIAEADGYIIISPEYNHGITAVLKNAMDWVYGDSWAKKPFGAVSYGSTLGARSIAALRTVAIECQLVPIRNSIHIPGDVYKAVAAAQNPADPQLWKPIREPMDRVGACLDQLLWFAQVLTRSSSESLVIFVSTICARRFASRS
jgi:NAD(P)H-dependent FMN reductase